MKRRYAVETTQESRRRFTCEVTAVAHEMHLVVIIVIDRDATPRAIGMTEFVIDHCVESGDPRVELGRHADLCQEASLELSRGQSGIVGHRRHPLNAVTRKYPV